MNIRKANTKRLLQRATRLARLFDERKLDEPQLLEMSNAMVELDKREPDKCHCWVCLTADEDKDLRFLCSPTPKEI